jgi:uncharacterized membrane protein YkvA (DUF1232 family)
MARRRKSEPKRNVVDAGLGTWQELVLAFRLYRDPRVSTFLKSIVPMLAALYVVSPVDLIPDFVLGVGQVDDLGVLGFAVFVGLKLIRRWAPSNIVAEHLAAMGLAADDGPTRRSTTGRGAVGDVIDASYRVVDRSDRRTTAGRGRRVA